MTITLVPLFSGLRILSRRSRLDPTTRTPAVRSLPASVLTIATSHTALAGTLNGAPLTKYAFKTGLPEGLSWFGGLVVAIGLILFAISTAISWSYYGNRAVTYMAGSTKLVMPYRWLYVGCLFLGANVTLSAVWAFADMTMALMAFFNLVGVIGLAGVLFALTKEYFSRTHEPYKP